MNLRLFLVTQWFDPEPTVKGLAFARELLKKGFEIEVITGFPNYPGGEIYPGYKIKLFQKEILDDIVITRLPLYPSHNKSRIGRVLNYISFSFSFLIYGLFIAKRADIIYAYHPPLTVGIVAVLIKKFRRTPVVYDIQDLWPDTLRATGMINNKLVLKAISLACEFVYMHVDHIVVLSNGFKAVLIERRVPENKIDVIYNWVDEVCIGSEEFDYPANFPSCERFKILFAGNIGKAQAMESVIDAASKLQFEHPNICFVILGEGIESTRLIKYAQDNSLRNVVFLPAVSISKVNNYLKAADVLLVHLKADPLFQLTIPSKTQAYMAAGKPILMAVDGEAAKLVETAGCGLIAKSQDSDDIARIVKHFASLDKKKLEHLGLNGKTYYKNYLSLKVGTARFSEIFANMQ